MTQALTCREALRRGREFLEKNGIDEPEENAWLLFSFLTGLSRAAYYVKAGDPFDQAENYEELLRRRAAHIPLQRITGSQDFMGLTFGVTEDTLIPRQDTETLVEEVLADQKGRTSPLKALDLCTGTGCIGLSLLVFLLRLRRQVQMTLTDLSGGALLAARENARGILKAEGFLPESEGLMSPSRADGNLLSVERPARSSGCPQNSSETADKLFQLAGPARGSTLTFLCSDLFEKVEGRFDLITSNPPYIPTGEISDLMPEVRDHEPVLALDGGRDGLDFYRRIAREAPAHLKPEGLLYLEIGYDQGESVPQILRAAGFRQVVMKKDLCGNPRVVKAKAPEKAEK